MRIENIRTEKNGTRSRVSATVTWEDCDRPVRELFYETEEAFATDLTCNPDSFLVGCVMPAMQHGEERVLIAGTVSPEIEEGMATAMNLFRQWFYSPSFALPRIETTGVRNGFRQSSSVRAGMFFSGGVDSLAILRSNRLLYPKEHPWAIRDAVLVCGLETDDEEKFSHVLQSVGDVASDAGLELIPVYTNVRQLEDDWNFWGNIFHDAVFASIAHAFSRRLNVVSISSTYDIVNLQPFGTHPLLDTCYSSHDMLIRHDGLNLTRLAKIRLIGDWDLAMQNLRVCNQSAEYESGMLNCGRCIKCVRTMLSLMALGMLDRTRAFPAHDVTPELLLSSIGMYRTTICFYEELIEPLVAIGRDDLASVIKEKIDEYRSRQELREARRSFEAVVKRFDNRFLYGSVKKIAARFRNGRPECSGEDTIART